jgi:EAL domain-containing protein (putative c-di-GMP-specific phosphodiesterase class I)
LLEFLRQQFTEFDVSPQNVCFEITETAAIHNFSQAIHFITAMKESGCRFALDDFGVGLSSFSYLKKLPVDYLKIDGSFVRDLGQDRVDQAMVSAINQIGHTMMIQTVAEHVETEGAEEQLRAMGIDYGQGYLFGTPKPLEALQDR